MHVYMPYCAMPVLDLLNKLYNNRKSQYNKVAD